MSNDPIIVWFRRDLRLNDHQALDAAAKTGRPIIPLFILDPETEDCGAAPLWRLGQAIDAFSKSVSALGNRLVLRKGRAFDVLTDITKETGATSVYWTRWYEPKAVARDTLVKSLLGRSGVETVSFPGFLLFEPWTVETGQGRPYSVYSPYWRAVCHRDVGGLVAAPNHLPLPERHPRSDCLDDWQLDARMKRGAGIVARYASVGEAAALERLDQFIHNAIGPYKVDRNRPDLDATSRLSENLTYGEISPRTIWYRGQQALHDGHQGAEHFLKELVWREFAWHLYWYAPDMVTKNWRDKWDGFPWRGDNSDAQAWCRAETGVDLVDAGLRELYATGTMHNRVRMVVASYLTKHLLTDWRVGRAWFEDTLIDWDPASNAMGWQWVAGCGPDAAPYFRIFNPDTQAETYDPDGTYRRHYLGTGQIGADGFAQAVPNSWNIARPSTPIMGLKEGRNRALEAYQSVKAET